MLLTQKENGAAGKTDTLPEDWFRDKPIEYLEMHLIPQDPELWKLDRYEEFIAARKKLILQKFSYLLASTSTVPTEPNTPLGSPIAGVNIQSTQGQPVQVAPAVRDLFEAFRREVLRLRAGITEEVLKVYIAYKATTNFVDVVPQSKGLRLILNLRFQEVHDPKRICRDISDIGHWGNGDVEVSLNSVDDLPYVMGLVRQSLEKQLDAAPEDNLTFKL